MQSLPSRKDIRLLSSLQDLKLDAKKQPNASFGKRKKRKNYEIRAIAETSTAQLENFTRCAKKITQKDRDFILKSLHGHFIFSSQDSQTLEALISQFQMCSIEKGHYLINQGDSASCFFILQAGSLVVQINDKCERRIKASEGFGELALLYNSPRSASIKATEKSFLWYINRSSFKNAVQSIIEKKYDENKSFIDKTSFFQQLSQDQRSQIASIAINQIYQQNAVICREGQLASSMYILISGSIKKYEGDTCLGTFDKKGELFEQNSIIESDSQRKCTLKTVTKTSILAISFGDIELALGRSFPIIVLRNKIKSMLKNEPIFKKLSKLYIQKLLDSFTLKKVNKSDAIVIKDIFMKNLIFFVQEGEFKCSQDKTNEMIFGLRCFAPEHREDLYDFQMKFITEGKIFYTSIQSIQDSFTCKIQEAFTNSEDQTKITNLRNCRISHLKSSLLNYQIDTFKIRKQLGEGSFGKVFLVTHEPTEQHYALKCISKTKTLASNMENYLIVLMNLSQNEKNALQKICSPFIVNFIRSFKDDHYIFFLMELIRGKQLFDVMRQLGLLSPSLSKFYIATLIHILEIFHSQNIVYRDLKPQNIMVTTDGYLKLVDLGTCKKISDKKNRTYTIIGTPTYMAPQVLLGKGYNHSVDLWSLGVIFYEFICGFMPYGEDCDDIYEIYRQILKKELAFPKFEGQAATQLNQACKLITQLLDKNPSNRLGGSYASIKKHPLFKNFNWHDLITKKTKPEYMVDPFEALQNEAIKVMPTYSLKSTLKEYNHAIPSKANLSKDWDSIFKN